MKKFLIRVEPFGYEKEVSAEKLKEFNQRMITVKSFKKLGIPMDSFTLTKITGISISPMFNSLA